MKLLSCPPNYAYNPLSHRCEPNAVCSQACQASLESSCSISEGDGDYIKTDLGDVLCKCNSPLYQYDITLRRCSLNLHEAYLANEYTLGFEYVLAVQEGSTSKIFKYYQTNNTLRIIPHEHGPVFPSYPTIFDIPSVCLNNTIEIKHVIKGFKNIPFVATCGEYVLMMDIEKAAYDPIHIKNFTNIIDAKIQSICQVDDHSNLYFLMCGQYYCQLLNVNYTNTLNFVKNVTAGPDTGTSQLSVPLKDHVLSPNLHSMVIKDKNLIIADQYSLYFTQSFENYTNLYVNLNITMPVDLSILDIQIYNHTLIIIGDKGTGFIYDLSIYVTLTNSEILQKANILGDIAYLMPSSLFDSAYQTLSFFTMYREGPRLYTITFGNCEIRSMDFTAVNVKNLDSILWQINWATDCIDIQEKKSSLSIEFINGTTQQYLDVSSKSSIVVDLPKDEPGIVARISNGLVSKSILINHMRCSQNGVIPCAGKGVCRGFCDCNNKNFGGPQCDTRYSEKMTFYISEYNGQRNSSCGSYENPCKNIDDVLRPKDEEPHRANKIIIEYIGKSTEIQILKPSQILVPVELNGNGVSMLVHCKTAFEVFSEFTVNNVSVYYNSLAYEFYSLGVLISNIYYEGGSSLIRSFGTRSLIHVTDATFNVSSGIYPIDVSGSQILMDLQRINLTSTTDFFLKCYGCTNVLIEDVQHVDSTASRNMEIDIQMHHDGIVRLNRVTSMLFTRKSINFLKVVPLSSSIKSLHLIIDNCKVDGLIEHQGQLTISNSTIFLYSDLQKFGINCQQSIKNQNVLLENFQIVKKNHRLLEHAVTIRASGNITLSNLFIHGANGPVIKITDGLDFEFSFGRYKTTRHINLFNVNLSRSKIPFTTHSYFQKYTPITIETKGIVNIRDFNGTLNEFPYSGCLFIISDKLNIKDSVFIENSGASSGSLVAKGDYFTMYDTLFLKNIGQCGSAINIESSKIDIKFVQNRFNTINEFHPSLTCAKSSTMVFFYKKSLSCDYTHNNDFIENIENEGNMGKHSADISFSAYDAFENCKNRVIIKNFISKKGIGETGSMYIQRVPVNINSATISDIYHSTSYGAISIRNTKFTVRNSNFYNNLGRKSAAIIIDTCVEGIVDSCHFSNITAREGGAIHVEKTDNITIINSTFTNIKSYEKGGAIYLAETSLSIKKSNFYNIHSSRGAIYTVNDDKKYGRIHLKNSTFSKCTSIYGGVINDISSELIMDDVVFNNNFAKKGGVFFLYKSHINSSRMTFNENQADIGSIAIFNDVELHQNHQISWKNVKSNTAKYSTFFFIGGNSTRSSNQLMNYVSTLTTLHTVPSYIKIRNITTEIGSFSDDETSITIPPNKPFSLEYTVYDRFNNEIKYFDNIRIHLQTLSNDYNCKLISGVAMEHFTITNEKMKFEELRESTCFINDHARLQIGFHILDELLQFETFHKTIEYTISKCLPGYGMNSDKTACSECGEGTYDVSYSINSCKACPDEVNPKNCLKNKVKVQEGGWAEVDDEGVVTMFLCQNKKYCVGGNIMGYNTTWANIHNFIPTNDLKCENHRDPKYPLCTVCKPPYSNWNGSCKYCADNFYIDTIIFYVLSVLGMVIYQHWSSNAVKRSENRILASFIQTIGITLDYKSKLTGSFFVVLSSLVSFLSLDFDLSFGGGSNEKVIKKPFSPFSRCAFKLEKYGVILFKLGHKLLPLFIILFCGFIALMFAPMRKLFRRLAGNKKASQSIDHLQEKLISRIKSGSLEDLGELEEEGEDIIADEVRAPAPQPTEKSKVSILKESIFTQLIQISANMLKRVAFLFTTRSFLITVINLILILYQPLTEIAISYFSCPVFKGETPRLFVQGDVKCYDGQWWLFALTIYIPLTLTLVILPAATLIILIILYYKKLLNHPTIKKWCGTIYQFYRDETFWFEVVFIFRRFGLVTIKIVAYFIRLNKPGEDAVASLGYTIILAVTLGFLIFFQPYKTKEENIADSLSHFIALCFLGIMDDTEGSKTYDAGIGICYTVSVIYVIILVFWAFVWSKPAFQTRIKSIASMLFDQFKKLFKKEKKTMTNHRQTFLENIADSMEDNDQLYVELDSEDDE